MQLLSLQQIEEGLEAKGLTIEDVKKAKYDKDKNLKEITVFSRYESLNSKIAIYYDVYGRCYQRKNNKRIAAMDLCIEH